MLRLAADENFNGDIVRGLLRRNPNLDIIRVQDMGLSGADEPSVLEWAVNQGRVMVTHDISTLAKHAFNRIAAGQPMPGVFEPLDREPTKTPFVPTSHEGSVTSSRAVDPAVAMFSLTAASYYPPTTHYPHLVHCFNAIVTACQGLHRLLSCCSLP